MLLTLLVRKGNYYILQSRELLNLNLVVRKPISMITFPRDSMFIGRETIIVDIDRRYKQAMIQNHTRLALVGLEGMG